MSQKPSVLLVGLGGFGNNHLRAWCEMGMADSLYVADLSEAQRENALKFNIPASRISADAGEFLERVDIVDVVTPTDSHFALCTTALDAGKDVFVEKPMTQDSDEAARLARRVADTGRILQIGYYYRFHPTSIRLKKLVQEGRLGQLRYLSGNFMGFKRARNDVGVTHTDGIHFLDLFNWIADAYPTRVVAVTRDHFERGLEDFSVVLLEYPNGLLAKVESGYIQPGRWRDKVVPGAYTSKEISACGSDATVEIDFETESMAIHDVHHEDVEGTWTAMMTGSEFPNTPPASPIQMLVAELETFLEHTRERTLPMVNAVGSGIVLARVIEAIYSSARQGASVDLTWDDLPPTVGSSS